MLKYKTFLAGSMAGSIRDFLDALPARRTSTRYALIAALDSNLAPATLLESSTELRRLGRKVKPLGQGLLLATDLLAEVHEQVLFGFDEVWFFPSRDISDKPASPTIVGPGRIEQETLKKLERWMTKNGCTLGLGDGDGLNFIIRAQGAVEDLLSFTITHAAENAPLAPPQLGVG
ncbi:MAG: hypothetical protein JSS27_15620 [Planctomycetes bacterium]|nr:hypothetical protein [Planctomycetota bacterium]